MKETKTCKSCVKWWTCPERSRDYPCRDFDDMYSDAETELRSEVARMLSQGVNTNIIAKTVIDNRHCTAIVKRRILSEIHK